MYVDSVSPKKFAHLEPKNGCNGGRVGLETNYLLY